jgi:hypothetical protein
MHRSEAGWSGALARVWGRMIIGLLLCTACCGVVRSTRAQSLEEKLGLATDYLPQASAPVDQLVEVAQRFKIPMAIEWLERAGTSTPNKAPPARQRSVRELIEEIARVSPDHWVEVEGGLVRVYPPVEAMHPSNFLNILLKSYQVNDGDLFAAEDQLRWAIRFTLEPEKYRYGYGGGYGHGANDVFEIPKFTISASNLTVREVLNKIAVAQGNALWVATIKSADLEAPEPYWKRRSADDGDRPVTSGWHFFPLADIPELAKEQVAVDVMLEGLLDRRMTTIPVMLEHGLTLNSGDAAGGTSSEDVSYDYAASVEKVSKDWVTLAVHLSVRRRGEADFNFDDKLRVTRSQVTELQPEYRIRIRAYIEPRSDTSRDHE